MPRCSESMLAKFLKHSDGQQRYPQGLVVLGLFQHGAGAGRGDAPSPWLVSSALSWMGPWVIWSSAWLAALPAAGGWNWMVFEAPSKPSCSVTLCCSQKLLANPAEQ